MIRIDEAATPDQLAELAALAHVIWHEHYPGIISRAQIDHMLAAGYAPAALAADQAGGARFFLAREAGQPVGFAGYSPEASDAAILWLDKLYVAREARSAGVARALLNRVIGHIDDHASTLKLRVNRHNDGAVAAYERLGFSVEHADIKEIGHGFVMDDFIMRRTL